MQYTRLAAAVLPAPTRLLLLLLAIVGGCQVAARDVTTEQRFHSGYVPGQTYVLVRDAVLTEREDGSRVLARRAAGAGQTIAVPAGTRVMVDRLVLVLRNFEESGLTPVVTLTVPGTPNRTIPEAELHYSVSANEWTVEEGHNVNVQSPDPQWMRPAAADVAAQTRN